MLTSLYDEMILQVQSMLNYFIMFRTCSQVSNYLFRLTQTSIRSLFEHLKALIDQIDLLIYKPETDAADTVAVEADKQLVRNATGMIWSVQEDLRALPGNNRNAFRRSVLVQMTTIKDTIREYQEYLQEAAEAKASGEEIVDDPDDELQSVPYTDSEVIIVTGCVDKMNLCEKCMKFGLQLITLVNDYMEPALNVTNSDAPVAVGVVSSTGLPPQPGSPSRESSGPTELTLNELKLTESPDGTRAEAVQEMRVLTSTMNEICTLLTHGCTDLGLELFVPFDMSKINNKLSELTELLKLLFKDHFLRMNELFLREMRRGGDVNEDGTKTAADAGAASLVVDKYHKMKSEVAELDRLINS